MLQEFVSAAQGKPWPFVGAVPCVRATETEVCVWYEAPGREHEALRWEPFNRRQLGLEQGPGLPAGRKPDEKEPGPSVVTDVAQTFLMGLLRALAFEPDVAPADPGDRRLHQLAVDPIFTRVPPSARSPVVRQRPAEHRNSAFDGQGWHWAAPTVSLTFESSSESRRAIYEYYSEKALADGWEAGELMMKILGPPYLSYTWTKTYPNGVTASLLLAWSGPPEPPPGPLTYRLIGTVALPSE